MSKEHIWPDWMSVLFPRTPNDQHERYRARVPFKGSINEVATTTTVTAQGHPSTRTVRKVCETCNRGWMSKMEKRTKPLLIRLARGESVMLDFFLQHALATWSAKTAMVAEFSDASTVAIPQVDRTWMMQKIEPPSGWNIWITRCRAPMWQPGYLHHSFTLGLSRTLRVTAAEPSGANTQSTTIGFGDLLIHMLSTAVPGLEFQGDGEARFGLRRIWPRMGDSISFRDCPILSANEAEQMADTLGRTLRGMPNLVVLPTART